MKYKDKPKYVSIRHMTGKLLQIDQRNKKGQNDGRIYFDKNGAHVEKHAQFALMDTQSEVLQCNKKKLCEYIYLTLMTKRLNELIKSYEGFFSSNSENIKS